MRDGEKFNSISHLAGAALALAGMAVLVVMAAQESDLWKIISFSVYGTTLLLLYTVSSLYHSAEGPSKKLLRKLDHLAIYLLIAGTYTPFTLIALRGAWGWWLFGIVWFLAALGIVLEVWTRERRRILPVVIYICMGWLILVAFKPLIAALSASGMSLLALGGLFYTFGVIFYALDKKARHFHGIWHLFVLAGSGAHYAVVLAYLA